MKAAIAETTPTTITADDFTLAEQIKLRRELEKTAEGRRAMALYSPQYFASRYFRTPLFPHQDGWANELDLITRGGIVAPPGHGKTRYFSRYMPLREICKDRDIRILLISKSSGQAEKRLDTVKFELEHNERLINDYGRFHDRRNKWTQRLFTVIKDSNQEDGTFEAVGLQKGITGNRVDLIILDDIIDAINSAKHTQREKILEYVKDTIMTRLDPNGRLLFIGTRFHPYDLYRYFIDHPLYKVIVCKAIIRESKHKIVELDKVEYDEKGKVITHTVKYEDDADQGECLTPEIWPMTRLLLTRCEISTRTFNRIYQSEPSSDETAFIKSTWLDACKDTTRSYGVFSRGDYMAVIEGNDPAVVTNKQEAEAKDSDFTVSITLGIKENRHYDLLGLSCDRGLTPKEIKDLFIRNARDFQPTIQFIEVNAHGEILRWNIQSETNVPIKKHKTTAYNKHDPYEGLTSVAVMFENNAISLPYKTQGDRDITDHLCSELNSVPTESGHDDQLLALWIAHAGALRYLKQYDKLAARQLRDEQVRSMLASA